MAKADKSSKKAAAPKKMADSAKDILARAAVVAKPESTSSFNGKTAGSSSDEDSSDDSDEDSTPAPVKTAPTPANKKREADDESSSDDSSDESDSDEDETSAPVQTAPNPANKKREADDEPSSDDSSDEEDKTPASLQTAPAPANKKRKVDEESSSDDSSDDSDEDEAPAPIQTAPAAANKKLVSNDETSSDSDSDEDEAPAPIQAAPSADKKRKADDESKGAPKKVKLANDSADAASSGEETKSVFVGRLSWNVDNDWLAQEFAECGEVESAHVSMDRNTGRSRAFGYVHFKTADAVEKALAMNGKEIDGRAVNIDKSNPPDKKASAEKRAQTFGDAQSPPSAVLFVGNLSWGVDEDTLWETFGEHGDVKSVRVPTDRESGKPKGFGYVEFSEIGAAKAAHGALQGFEIDGRAIRLDFSQPRDSAGGRGGAQGGRGGGRGEFGGDRGRGGGRGGFGGDRGRGGGRGGFGGDRGGFGGDRGRGGGRGGFGGDRGRGGGRGGFGGDRGRGGGRGGYSRGGERGGRGRGARTGGITKFEGQKITFD